jgi:hypothetical protein
MTPIKYYLGTPLGPRLQGWKLRLVCALVAVYSLALALAGRIIGSRVNKAGLADVLGLTGQVIAGQHSVDDLEYAELRV